MTMTLCYHLGGLFHRLLLRDILHDHHDNHFLLDVLHDHLVTHLLLDVLHDHLIKHLLLPILDVLHELYVEKAKKNKPKKEKKIGGGSCPPGKCFFLGVGNVRIWGGEMSEFWGW